MYDSPDVSISDMLPELKDVHSSLKEWRKDRNACLRDYQRNLDIAKMYAKFFRENKAVSCEDSTPFAEVLEWMISELEAKNA